MTQAPPAEAPDPTGDEKPDDKDTQDAPQGDETAEATKEATDSSPDAAQDTQGDYNADTIVGDPIGDFEIHRNPVPDAVPGFAVVCTAPGYEIVIPTGSDVSAAEIAHVLAERAEL